MQYTLCKLKTNLLVKLKDREGSGHYLRLCQWQVHLRDPEWYVKFPGISSVEGNWIDEKQQSVILVDEGEWRKSSRHSVASEGLLLSA